MGLELSRDSISRTIGSIARQLPMLDAKRAGIELFGAPSFNAFTLFSPNENTLSRIAQDLFDPRGAHGQGALFLNSLLKTIGLEQVGYLDVVKVDREVRTDANRRIDLVIETPTALVGIENKPWAGQQENQLSDYLVALRHWGGGNGKRVELVFLSPSEPETAKDDVIEVTFAPGSNGRPSLQAILEDAKAKVKAARVAAHIDEFIHYIAEQFGGQEMKSESEMVFIEAVEHEFAKPEGRRAIAAVMAAHRRLYHSVLADIAGFILEQLGPDFHVEGGATLQECLAVKNKPWLIARKGWPRNLHLAIESDGSNYRSVDYGVRAPKPGNVEAVRCDEVCNEIALIEHSLVNGFGVKKSDWWPWYVHCTTRDWTSDFAARILLECQSGKVGDHSEISELAERFVTLANCIDEALANSPTT